MTPPSRKFAVDPGWQILLRDLGVVPQDVLRHARLPLDLFSRAAPTLSTEEYFRLWHSLEALLDDPAFPLRLVRAFTVEAFSPPIFASLCSANLNTALHRLSQYKPLIGPLRLDVTVDDRETVAVLGGLPEEIPPPGSLIATELVFLVQLARIATRTRIEPAQVRATVPLSPHRAFEEFFGTVVERTDEAGVSFRADDAARPFLTASESLWAVFEPELRNRMADLRRQSGFRDRVRACLMETLAGGGVSMADVSDRLAVGRAPCNGGCARRGRASSLSLTGCERSWPNHYLTTSRYSSAEIAFLLGYDDPNSFIRAFSGWTGRPPQSARAGVRPN